MSDHLDLIGIRWSQGMPLALDDSRGGRTIPLDEAEEHVVEHGPTGITPSGLSWDRYPVHVLKDPNRIYEAQVAGGRSDE